MQCTISILSERLTMLRENKASRAEKRKTNLQTNYERIILDDRWEVGKESFIVDYLDWNNKKLSILFCLNVTCVIFHWGRGREN